MDLSELPQKARLKLSEPSRQKFWRKIKRKGGIKEFCQQSQYSSSKMYNWKNKNSFLPAKLIARIFEGEKPEIKQIKGEGRSTPIREPNFDFPEIHELLTRINTSVTVNSKGSPMYQTDDIGNVERFTELLQRTGKFSFHVYSRESYYQINYPKFLHKVLVSKDFEPDPSAMVDEKAEIEGDYFVLEEDRIKISDFEGKLHSRNKSVRKALEAGNQEKIEKIIASEAERAEKLFDQ